MSQSQSLLQQSMEEETTLEIELKEKKSIMSNTVIQIGTESIEPQEIKFRHYYKQKVQNNFYLNQRYSKGKSNFRKIYLQILRVLHIIDSINQLFLKKITVENLIKNSQTFLVNQEIDEITSYETIFLGVKNINIVKTKIKEMEQNERQQIQFRKQQIDNVKEQQTKQLYIQEESLKFFWDLFTSQQNKIYFKTLQEQHQCGKLGNQILLDNHLLNDYELNTWIQEIQVIDIQIQNITAMLGSRKKVSSIIFNILYLQKVNNFLYSLGSNMYDRVKNIMENQYKIIINLNKLALQKKELVNNILKKLRSDERAFKTSSTNSLQSDKQNVQENIIQFKEINKNVEKYFSILNFHFNNEDLLKQIETLEQIKKKQEEQNEALQKTIENLEQQLIKEKETGLNLLAELKKQNEIEKGEFQIQVQQFKQELKYQKEQVLYLANQVKQQSQKDDVQENIILQLKKQLDQQNIKNEQNTTSLQIMQNNENSDEYGDVYIQSDIKLYYFLLNLRRQNLTVIQMFIKSSSIESQSYFGFCDQNIDIQDLESNFKDIDNPPKSVFFFLSLQGNLRIQNPIKKSKLKTGGFQGVNYAVFIYDSHNNYLTIFKNYLEIESLEIILPMNEKTVIPFVKQANEEQIILRIV